MKININKKCCRLVTSLALIAIAGCKGTQERVSEDITQSVEPSTQLAASEFAVNPPVSDWLPGLVFKGSVTKDGLVVERRVCSHLLPPRKNSQGKEEEYHEATILTVRSSKEEAMRLGALLNPLENILGKNKVQLDLAKFERKNAVNFDPGEVKHLYYEDADKFRVENDQLKYVKINPGCQATMNEPHIKEALEKRQIYLVPAVIAQTGIKYEFTKATEFDSTLKADFEKILTASIYGGFKKEEKGGITEIGMKSITTRTARPELITIWIPSGAIGARPEAQIKLEKEKRDIKQILGLENLRDKDN